MPRKKKNQDIKSTQQLRREADKQVAIDEVKKHIFHIHQELLQISKKCEDVDITSEGASIGDTLDLIEDCFKELEDKYDEMYWEMKALGAETEELKAEVDRITEYSDGLTDVNTMVGELHYRTNNFMDADLMDLFTQCLAEIRPADLTNKLLEILRPAEIAIDDIL